MSEAASKGARGAATDTLPGVAAALLAGGVGHGSIETFALLALPFAAISYVAGAARRRLEVDDERYAVALLTTSTAATLSALALSVFGALLKANTHHKALAGTTFAIVAAGVLAGALLASARLARLLVGGSALRPSRLRLLFALSLFVTMDVVVFSLHRAELLRLDRLDLACAFLALASGFFFRVKPLPSAARIAAIALPLALAVFGVARLGDDALARAVRDHGPIASAIVDAVHPSALAASEPEAPSSSPEPASRVAPSSSAP